MIGLLYLLFVVGIVLCVLAFRAVEFLRKHTDSIQVQQIAGETQTIGVMAAILMAGRLANPKYREELTALRQDLSEAEESRREGREQWGKDYIEENDPMVKLCRDCERDLHQADVFHWEGQKHLIELARDAYRSIKSNKAD